MSDYIPSFYRYVSSITIDNGGAGYQNVPTITISGGNGTGATATAEVFNGAISKINITNIGSGYTSTPTVTITPDSSDTITTEAVLTAVLDSAQGQIQYEKRNQNISFLSLTIEIDAENTRKSILQVPGPQNDLGYEFWEPSGGTSPS